MLGAGSNSLFDCFCEKFSAPGCEPVMRKSMYGLEYRICAPRYAKNKEIRAPLKGKIGARNAQKYVRAGVCASVRARNAQLFFAYLGAQLGGRSAQIGLRLRRTNFLHFLGIWRTNFVTKPLGYFAHSGAEKLGILAHKYVRAGVYN